MSSGSPDNVQNNAEKNLLQRVAGGDQVAFGLIFERYRNRLFTYLVKVTKSRETSEEIVLDVFLKIWTGRELIKEIANFEAFIFRVAHNKAIDFLRTLQTKPEVQKQVWEKMEIISNDATDDKIIQKETAQNIETAVKNLSPQRRKVYLLSREEGLSYDQIARRLHISSNTVRNHVSASLEFIRNFINKNMIFIF
ncbi:MAG: RNA polymerase sigma-70 factor [Bacteroidales bacterium]|nr:RNA polymerase sigma-70 factor [Bacteroidales bacterium]MDD2424408.1 RNA polymerase sigma-70 factor [Bacteroidales bacterium]MDD3988990.1 RNA polymerase sigma-70 factor [Bacteroidales bacterium]MDD4638306.1 RNA polymerase sigma-70 factor [Bacteroidales bacterium]